MRRGYIRFLPDGVDPSGEKEASSGEGTETQFKAELRNVKALNICNAYRYRAYCTSRHTAVTRQNQQTLHSAGGSSYPAKLHHILNVKPKCDRAHQGQSAPCSLRHIVRIAPSSILSWRTTRRHWNLERENKKHYPTNREECIKSEKARQSASICRKRALSCARDV